LRQPIDPDDDKTTRRDAQRRRSSVIVLAGRQHTASRHFLDQSIGQQLADRLLGEAGLQREPRLIWPGAGAPGLGGGLIQVNLTHQNYEQVTCLCPPHRTGPQKPARAVSLGPAEAVGGTNYADYNHHIGEGFFNLALAMARSAVSKPSVKDA
jgi:hypothetical protein